MCYLMGNFARMQRRPIRLRQGYVGQGKGNLENMCFCETNPNYLKEKTGVNALWRKWMQSKIVKITIGFVWCENDGKRAAHPAIGGSTATERRGYKERGVGQQNSAHRALLQPADSAVHRTAATTGRRKAMKASEKLLTGRSLLTGRGLRGSKGLTARGFYGIMRCPKCTGVDDKVIDSRSSRDGLLIRRRRECLKCGARFTTYEEIFREKLRVKKRDGQYEEFDRRKLLAGMEKACEKRPVSTEEIESLAERVITELENEFGREVPSKQIGERIMQHLRKLDEVAYVRFASVYRQFRDAEQFIDEIKQLGKS
jgi:transcriptional repressor NrdR